MSTFRFEINPCIFHKATVRHDAIMSDGMILQGLWEQFGRLLPHKVHISLL